MSHTHPTPWLTLGMAASYRIRIQGALDPGWSDRLGGMRITTCRRAGHIPVTTLPCPDHTTLSRRNATVEIRRQIDRAPQGSVCVIVDSTGLKVCGQGEWHSQKHGEKQRKRWKKLHIGVDDHGQILASTVTDTPMTHCQ